MKGRIGKYLSLLALVFAFATPAFSEESKRDFYEGDLTGGGKIGAHKLHVGQLHLAVVTLSVQEVHQRCRTLLPGERNRIPDTRGLSKVLLFVRAKQNQAVLLDTPSRKRFSSRRAASIQTRDSSISRSRTSDCVASSASLRHSRA